MSRLKLFIPLAVFVLLALLFWRGLSIDPSEMPSALIDRPVPKFLLPSLQGAEAALDENIFKGQVTLLNVWATWCISCRAEHPFLLAISSGKIKATDAGGRIDVRIIGVNYKDNSAAAKKWLKELGDPYQLNVVDADGYLGLDLGVFGAPETYVVDSKGIIRYKHVGVLNQRVWDDKLQPMIESL